MTYYRPKVGEGIGRFKTVVLQSLFLKKRNKQFLVLKIRVETVNDERTRTLLLITSQKLKGGILVSLRTSRF